MTTCGGCVRSGRSQSIDCDSCLAENLYKGCMILGRYEGGFSEENKVYDLIMTKKYPARGIKEIKFSCELALKRFNMQELYIQGLIIQIKPNTPVQDFKFMYNGDIIVKNEDGTTSYPNRPFFVFDIDNKPLLSMPVCSISCAVRSSFTGFSLINGQPRDTYMRLPINIKSEQKLNVMIKYPLHEVPLPSGQANYFTVKFIGMKIKEK